MGTADLPFLIVHGPLVWSAAIVATALIAIGVVVGIRWLSARRALAKTMRGVDRHAERGRLRVVRSDDRVLVTTADATHDTIGMPAGHADHRSSAEIWLDTGTRSIRLDGPLTALAGTSAMARRRKLPPLPDQVTRTIHDSIPWLAGSCGTTRVVTLAAGDEVLVHGTALPHPGQGETGHRDADVGWSMHGGDAPLPIAAVAPKSKAIPLGIVRIALIGGLAAGAARCGETALSDHYASTCKPSEEVANATEPLELTNGHSCVMLASLPKHRELGIQRVLELLESYPLRDARLIATYDELGREHGECDQRLRGMMSSLRYEAAVEEAGRCNDPRTRHEALVGLGRFDEAASLAVPADAEHEALPTVETLIAAGRWTEAATATERSDGRVTEPEERLYRRCFGEFLRSRGGDPGARSRLVTLSKQESGAVCNAMISELDPDFRKTWLAEPQLEAYSPGVYELRFAAGKEDLEPYGKPEQLLVHPESSVGAALIWLPIEPATPALQVHRLRWRAVGQVMAHDLRGARESARAALAIARQHDLAIDGLDDLLPAIALHTSDTDQQPVIPEAGIKRELWMFVNGRLLVRAGLPVDEAYFGPGGLGKALSVRGDGAPLARYLRKPTAWWSAGDVMAVWPRLTSPTVRAELASRVEWAPAYEGLGIDARPIVGAMHAFARRQTLAAIGAVEAAQAWDVVFQRFDRVLRDRDRLVALMMWR